MTPGRLRLMVCASGGGTTLRNLAERAAAGELAGEVVRVVASRPDVGALAVAAEFGIPAVVVARAGRDVESFSADVFDQARHSRVDLVVLGGFLALLRIPPDYEGRVINIHPSLIPAFCGRGMHGMAVHRAALDRGVKLSGCTVHFVDQDYDAGPIILQRAVPVLGGDSPESLARRVFNAECEALPAAIALYAAGRLVIDGELVRILDEEIGS